MKTAMQEHVQWLKEVVEISKEQQCSQDVINALEYCIEGAQSKLEMEKEQIISADFAGVKRTIIEVNKHIQIPFTMKDIEDIENGLEKHEDGERYYNETFKSKSYQQKMKGKVDNYKNNFKSE